MNHTDLSAPSPYRHAGAGGRRLRLVALAAGIGLVGWGIAAFLAGDSVPGYVHRNGAGSAVDVRSDGTHDGAGWTVVFTRSLRTGDPARDIEFAPGGTYYFQVTTWDNAGGMAHNIADALNVYSMTLPATPGPLVFSATPELLVELTGQYLASDELQITARWADPTRNDQRNRWTFSGTAWVKAALPAEDDEDRLSIIWDMQEDGFASAGTCTAMCHLPDRMYTAPGTFVDTWHWKAARTNPAGYADDQYWDDGNGGTASGRRSDPGVVPYRSNVAGTWPASMAEGDPGRNASFIFDFPEGTKAAAPYAAGAWNAGDVLPGYVSRRGSGSRVDTLATGTHDGAGWTVTFRRKLDTGDPAHDIVFLPSGTYYFQVAAWDNAGGMAHDIADALNVYSMTLPAGPGPLVFSATPELLVELTGQYLASDELQITARWADPTRNDQRKRWTFNGTEWVQAALPAEDDEDRLSIIWDMQEDGFAAAGTCTAMCHLPDRMYTALGTFVDTWHWKAARTNPAGYADDQYWDDGAGGTTSGRRNDPGTAVTKDNAVAGAAPSFMSVEGPGASAQFLFDHAPAAGWTRAVVFATASTVDKAKLAVSFKKASQDSLMLAGTYQATPPPGLADELTGTFEAGAFAKAFTLDARGKSAKDPNLKVTLSAQRSVWAVQLKRVDLAAALGIADANLPKPGIPVEVAWKLSLSNGWRIAGTVTLTYTARTGIGGRGAL